jgi:hypothetical protein
MTVTLAPIVATSFLFPGTASRSPETKRYSRKRDDAPKNNENSIRWSQKLQIKMIFRCNQISPIKCKETSNQTENCLPVL